MREDGTKLRPDAVSEVHEEHKGDRELINTFVAK